MKFAIFGNTDCPDWILGGIPVLSRVSCIRVALLALYILQDSQSEVEEKHDEESRREMNRKMSILLDQKVENEGEFELVIAALRCLLLSGIQYEVASDKFEDECLQLGLPKDTSAALRRRYTHAIEVQGIDNVLRDNCIKGT